MPTLADIRLKVPELQGLDDESALSVIQQVYYPTVPIEALAERLGFKPPAPPLPERSLFAAANDTVIDTANAVAGGVGSVADFVSPGNPVSKAIDENIIRPGLEKQSDRKKAINAELQAGIANAEGLGDEAMAALRYAAADPAGVLGQAVGSFVLPGAAIKGAGAAGAALGLNAARAGLAGGAAAGAALSGGDAAGQAYEEALNAGATEEQAQEAARQASILPAAVGGLGGMVGAERIFAGGKGFAGNALSRGVKGALSEGAQEAVEEGVTQFEANRAVAPFDGRDPMAGVGAAATLGGVMGGALGGGISALSPRAAADEALVEIGAAKTPEQAIDAFTRATDIPVAPPGFDDAKALDTIDAQRAADEKSLNDYSAGANAFRGLPPTGRPADQPAQPDGQSTEASATVVPDAPFSDRVLSVRQQLADPVAAQRIREKVGEQAFSDIAYYASVADRADLNIPEKTRERFVSLAERLISDSVVQRVERQGVTAATATAAPRIGQTQVPRIGLDAAPTGNIRVDSQGNAAPETNADSINTRNAAVRPADELPARTVGRAQPATAPEVQRAPRSKTGPGVVIDTVDSFVAEQRRTNTPQAREFTRLFDAGRITRDDVQGLLAKRPRTEAETAQERIETAAAAAPKQDLILTGDGFPYGTRSAAQARANKEGESSVIEVAGGFAVRKNDVSQPVVSGTPAGSAGAGNAGSAADPRGGGNLRPDAGQPARLDRATGAPEGRRAPAEPVAVEGQRDEALTAGAATLRQRWDKFKAGADSALDKAARQELEIQAERVAEADRQGRLTAQDKLDIAGVRVRFDNAAEAARAIDKILRRKSAGNSAFMTPQVDAANSVDASGRLDHGELSIPGRTNNINRDLDRYKAEQATKEATQRKQDTAERKADKQRARELFDQVGAAIVEKNGEKMGAKELRNELDQMVKWEPKKFITLAEKFQAEQASEAAQDSAPPTKPARDDAKIELRKRLSVLNALKECMNG